MSDAIKRAMKSFNKESSFLRFNGGKPKGRKKGCVAWNKGMKFKDNEVENGK